MRLMAMAIGAVLLIASSDASAIRDLKEIEQGYEVNELRVFMRNSGTGVATVNICDPVTGACKDMDLRITPETRVFKGGVEVGLDELMRLRGQEGVVFKDQESDRVTRIKIY